jgi:hypothetical protein
MPQASTSSLVPRQRFKPGGKTPTFMTLNQQCRKHDSRVKETLCLSLQLLCTSSESELTSLWISYVGTLHLNLIPLPISDNIAGIEESSNSQLKKRRLTDYLFSRQPSDHVPATSSPIIRRIKQPIPRTGSAPSLSQPGQLQNVDKEPLANKQLGLQMISITESLPAQQTAPNPTHIPLPNTQRSFYISRNALPDSSPVNSGRKKASATPIVFSERRPRPKRSPEDSVTDPLHSTLLPTIFPPVTEPSRPLKKPGRGARTVAKPAGKPGQITPSTPSFNVRVPSGIDMPWDVGSERLAAEMQAYTIEEISRTIAATSSLTPKITSPKSSTPSKFKPMKPKLRYHERHPDENVSSWQSKRLDEHYASDEEMDDADYIIDTYIRIPADTMIGDLDMDKNFGLLVLDGDADIDEFYRESLEEEEDDEDEDEDENAENHYSADYPDEEVESDDEFDRNPYNYRGNQCNEPEDNYSEEDDDNAAFSDGDEARYPWKAKPFSTQAF